MAHIDRLSFDEVISASYSTSPQADEIAQGLKRHLGFTGNNQVARLAMARSLVVAEQPPLISGGGNAIKGQNLFDKDARLWTSLLLEHAEIDDATVSAVQDLVRRHWARGATLLEADWKAAGDDYDVLIQRLAQMAGLPDTGAQVSTTALRGSVGLATAIRVALGDVSQRVDTNERIEWPLNGSGGSPHFAVMGASGTGKTRTAMSMIRSIRAQAQCPVILFDMSKGDLAGDDDLVRDLDATVVNPSRQPIPLDVLYAPVGGDVVDIAMRFRESFVRVPNTRIGPAQATVISDAAREALQKNHPTRIQDVQDRLRELYADQRKKDDSVIATFNDMTSRTLFDPKLSPADFFARSWIFDLRSADDQTKRLVVFLIVDALYAHLRVLGDAVLDEHGNRAVRVVLALDEAHRVLRKYQPASLASLVRESRSKGGVVALMSQSPDDFDSGEENFLEHLGLTLVFRTNAQAPAIANMLGQKVDLAGLPDGVCVTRFGGDRAVKIQSWQPDPQKKTLEV